jgi:predicted PurR-regulated permease PerM
VAMPERSLLTLESRVHNEGVTQRAVDVFVHIGLITLLAAACFVILRPFIPLLAWGIIVAVAVYPGYRKLKDLFGGRGGLAAIACTLLLLALLIVPVALLTGTLIEGVQAATAAFKNGTLTIPPPPPRVGTWPLIGVPLTNLWNQASSNLNAVLRTFAPQIKTIVQGLLSASAGIGLTVLQFVLSILVAGVLLAYGRPASGVARSITNRLFGERGPEFEELASSTIRSVTTGILGVAFIQSIFAGAGFLMVGLPGAGLWAAAFLFAAALQVGAIVLIPPVIYVFAVASSTKAVMFLIWCVFVGLMDNVLKPLLLGRAAAVPMVVVFLGVIGGFMAMGIIGLFVGAIVLSVGYKLLLAWLTPPAVSSS